MKYTLSELERFKRKRDDVRGSELNREYWSGRLADAFPQVIERENEQVKKIKFMGITFVRSDES